MLLMDVDRFKSINDTYGHDTGDCVIMQLGSFLAGRFTGNEIVGRFGGDEFVVFVRGTDDPEAACAIADEIVRGVAERVTLPDRERKISVSIGIATCNGEEKNYSDIFRKADMAMYRSKGDPEKRFYMYE